MKHIFWLKFRLIFVAGGFFVVFLFLPAQPVEACSNKVIFREKVIDQMFASAPFQSWQEWVPAQGYSADGELLQDCFDGGLPEFVFRLAVQVQASSSVAAQHPQTYLFAHITADGHMDATEANNIYTLGAQADALATAASRRSRFQEFIRVTGATPLLVSNASVRDQATVQIPAGFTGIYYGQHPFRSSREFTDKPQYAAYDAVQGVFFYQLALAQEWKNFPEIERVKDLYTQAAHAVTANCEINFADTDMIRAVIPMTPGRAWEFEIYARSDNCPNAFFTDFTSVDYTDYNVSDLAGLSFSSSAPATELTSFSAPVRVVHTGVYTSYTLNRVVFGHFFNILVILKK